MSGSAAWYVPSVDAGVIASSLHDDSWLRSTVRCPVCRSPLNEGDGELRCANTSGEHIFPVLNGVPILINEGNSVFSVAEVIAHATSPTSEFGVLEIAERVLPSFYRIGTKRANYATLAGLLLARTSDPKLLVVGAGEIGAGMEPLLDASPPIRLVETDVAVRSRTHVACDAHDLPFADEAFDGVVVQAVLEHVLDPYRCVAEIHRVLAPRGFVYAETPFMARYTQGRTTSRGLRTSATVASSGTSTRSRAAQVRARGPRLRGPTSTSPYLSQRPGVLGR